MRRFVWMLLGVLLLLGCDSAEPASLSNDLGDDGGGAAEGVDTNEVVYTNGAIYTVNPDQPWADAVAVRDGVIVAVGSEDDALAAVGESAEIVDLDGTMMLPGFHDVHLHAIEAGMNEEVCAFDAFSTEDDLVGELEYCAYTLQPDSDWVRGAGLNTAFALAYEISPIELLDEIVPDRPVLILDDVGHGAIANTLALEAAGYTNLDDNPPGGVVVRDFATGELTGVVLENAQQKLRTASLEPTDENLERAYQGLLLALDTLAENGITSISDAGGYWTRGHIDVWQRAAAEEVLSVRASNALYLFPDRPFDAQLAELEALYSNDPNALLRFDQVKIYMDGIVSQGTGMMLQDYQALYGLPGVSADGFPYFESSTLEKYAVALDAAGFQMHIHVTGDRATREALDAIELAQQQNGDSDRRHRLTHLYLVDAADRPRFAELGVTADLQLAPSSVDQAYVDDMSELIGGRSAELLPAFDLHDAGATVTISSDWDADALSPFVKMESILGQNAPNVPSLETIIEWMTINPAWLLHQDDVVGTIEVGKSADLVVIDQNIFEVSPSRLSDTTVLITLLEGEEVYRHADAP